MEVYVVAMESVLQHLFEEEKNWNGYNEVYVEAKQIEYHACEWFTAQNHLSHNSCKWQSRKMIVQAT